MSEVTSRVMNQPKSEAVLAVDQSTSASKAILFDAAGGVIDKASIGHEQHYPRPAWVEHDAEEIYRNTVGAIRDVVGRNPGVEISHLSITNQRETFVVFGRRTGRPLRRAIVWQCRRGEAVCREMSAAGHEERVRRSTGLPIDTYFPAPKLKWLMEESAGVRKALHEGDAVFGTIDTYLIHRLTGGEVFATDHSNASRTLLFNIDSLTWDEDLCRLFGVPIGALPEVRESKALFGKTDCEGALPTAVPICGVMGDSQAALFAQRCFRPGSVKVTFGTGSSCLLNIGHDFRLAEGGLVTALAWVWGGKPTYALEGIVNFAGATIAWLRDQLGLIEDAGETEALAAAVEDNGGVYLVPAFVGLSAPYWDQSARGAIVGLTPHSTREHVVRAALEGIAYQVREVLEAMSADSGIALESVNADGGMVANRFLMQFVADVAGLEVRASDLPELSALGAALSGALGTGARASLEEIERLPRSFDRYSPAMSPGKVRANFRGWKNAVRRVLQQEQRPEEEPDRTS